MGGRWLYRFILSYIKINISWIFMDREEVVDRGYVDWES